MSNFQYIVFKTAAREKSFLKAAEILNLTPSAVSHSISNLESRLGFPLFIRSRSGVQLTLNGEMMLPEINALIQCEERVEQAAAELCGIRRGTVRIGCFRSAMIAWIPGIIQTFNELYPSIEVIVFQGIYETVIEWLKNGVIDLAFLSQNVVKDLPFQPFYRDMLVCAAPKSMQFAHKDYVEISDLQNVNMIFQISTDNIHLNEFLAKYGLRSQSNFFISDDDAIVTLVENGFGIAILPELVFWHMPLKANIYPVKPEEYRTIGLASLRPEAEAPAARKMREHIIDYVQAKQWLKS